MNAKPLSKFLTPGISAFMILFSRIFPICLFTVQIKPEIRVKTFKISKTGRELEDKIDGKKNNLYYFKKTRKLQRNLEFKCTHTAHIL